MIPVPVPAPPADRAPSPALPGGGYLWGTGRRKTAIARVRLRAGTGVVVVNGRPLDEFFQRMRDRQTAVAPLVVLGLKDQWDVSVNATGGGITGQADAMLLGISRALLKYDGALLERLREQGFLSRDSREKERKKYGKPGARRSFQFSKR